MNRVSRIARRSVLLVLAALASARAGAADSSHAPKRSTTVFAAASLSDAFKEIGHNLEQRQNIHVDFNFAGSQQLAAQIEQGATADLFASADMRWMDYLRERSMVAPGDTVFCHNRLVVVVPKANPARIKSIQDLARPGVKLVLAAQAVPVGEYSRECLHNLSHLPDFGDDFATKALHNVVSEEENVKSVVSKVQLNEADAGLVYWSDVTPAVSRLVRVFEIPKGANVLASYPIARLRRQKHPDEADAFLSYLLSSEGQAILVQNGLLPAGFLQP
ncbi:MAG: molybdate ABC transporter substrate-binding protein [Candidatus Eiseniibacteriota bacterium]